MENDGEHVEVVENYFMLLYLYYFIIRVQREDFNNRSPLRILVANLISSEYNNNLYKRSGLDENQFSRLCSRVEDRVKRDYDDVV